MATISPDLTPNRKDDERLGRIYGSDMSILLDTSCEDLKGRANEIDQLTEVYDRVRDTGSSEYIFLRGTAGTGKTSLVKHVFSDKNVTQRDGYFASGKFDHVRNSDPYSALVTTFNTLCDGVAMNSNHKDQVKSALLNSLGEKDLEVFSALVSGIAKIINETRPKANRQLPRGSWSRDRGGQDFNMGQAFVRFKQQCRAFLQSISSEEHPVVIFIDDLQFGDTESMEVLQSLMESAADFECLLIVASYRDDHTGGPHQALVSKANEDPSFSLRATQIKVGDLDRVRVNEMVSDILNLDHSETWELSAICHLKTNGNPFFLQQFLRLLVNESLLVYSHTTNSWEWDDIKVQSETNVTRNILEVITERAKHIEPSVREVLKQASFLGFTFDVDLLQVIVSPAEQECSDGTDNYLACSQVVISALRVAQKQGFIEAVGDQLTCKWTHDRVMQSFQSMVVDESEKARTHFCIGERLRKSGLVMSSERQFLLVDQLNLGASCMTEASDKVRLAEMNLDVGEMSLVKSAFAMGQRYFEQGIALLPADKWSEHHTLALCLYGNAAEAAHSNGDLAKTMEMTASILANGQGIEETFPASCINIQLLYYQCRYNESSRAANTVLKQLGVFVPLRPSVFHVLHELFVVKRLLKGKSDDFIKSLPKMGKTNVMAMQVLGVATKTAYAADASSLMAVVCLRALRLSLLYGQCEYTPHGVAMYGLIQSSMGNYHEAYRFGSLALNMIQGGSASKAEVPVIAVVYSCVMHIQDPPSTTLESQLQGFQKAIEVGDIAWALVIGFSACSTMYFIGTNLHITESKLRMMVSLASEFQETSILPWLQSTLQAVLNLLGESEDPAVLQGEAVPDFVGFLKQDNPFAAHLARVHAMQIACIVESWEVAKKNCLAHEKHCSDQHHFNFSWPFAALCCALSYMANYRKSRRRKDLAKFRKYRKAAELHLKKGQRTVAPTLAFMHAEAVSLIGTKDMVVLAYGKAVDAMRDAGNIGQEGLAHEHFGNVIIERFSDYETAFGAYLCAIETYTAWGANVKVDQVQLKLAAFRG